MTNSKYNNTLKGALLAVGILLAGCSDDISNTLLQQRQTLDIQANVQQDNVTRANDNGFAHGDQIGVFVVNYEGENTAPTLQLSGNHADNVRFTYDDNEYKWTGSYQLYWKDNKTPIDVYGYYPFISQFSSITEQSFSVQRNQRDTEKGETKSGYEKSDFLWAKAENIAPTDATIILKHHHIMAGVEVTLVEGTGFANGEWIDADKNVLVQNTVMSGTINMREGSVTATGAASETGIIPQESKGKYRAIVLPQTIASGKTLFDVTVAGKAMHFTRDEAMEYVSSKLHKFTFEVNKTSDTGNYELKLLSDAIVNWENDPLSHNGIAREYITVHVNEGEDIAEVLKRMGIEDPSQIKNLKVTGCFKGDGNFFYIRNNMPYLEALNMKDLRSKGITCFSWENGWGEPPLYDFLHFDGNAIVYGDDFIPGSTWYGGVFENMEFLQYVVWPDHLKGIGNMAFAGVPLRGSLILPEGLWYLGGDVFNAYGHRENNMTGELYLPSTLEIIQCYFPKYLTGEVVLPAKMRELSGTFGNCTRLTGTIHIPDGLEEVNAFAAPNMTGDVIIPQGVKKVNGIGGKPTSIYFPEGVEEIGFEAFWNVSSLKGDLYLPSTIKTIASTAFAGTSFSHISLPEHLEIIDYAILCGCSSLIDTLTIPSSVSRIKSRAFEGCDKLNAIILPENLEMISGDCMSGCWSLDYIQCNAKEPPLVEGDNFGGLEKNNITLVVPEGSVAKYREAPAWREFKRISAYNNFVCRPMNAKLLNKASTRSVILNANGNWKITHCPDWVHVNKTSGYKKTELTVNIDALAHGSASRADSVVFTLTDKVHEDGNPITCYYKVQQFDYQYDEDSQVQLQKHTKGKGVNLVFMGDGYDAEDISKENYLADIREGMEYFFAVEPYKTYQDYFDVYVDFPMSYESGICSNVNIWRTTKFDTTYGAGNNGRLKVNFDDMMSYVMNDVTGTIVNGSNVDQTLVITILNSDVYEGLACLWTSGAAIVAVPHSRYGYPYDYRGVIQHEAAGHGFGKLGDEYIYHRDNIRKCTCVCCGHAADVEWHKGIGWYRNLSLNGRYKEIDWTHLIFDDRYQDIVDIYEGGYMHGEGIYRSELNSCMNNNVPYFSTISRQAIVERILDYAGERFDFETFVSKDSREMGDKFLTRSGSAGEISTGIRGNLPQIIKGSPLQNMKRKVKYNVKKQAR